MLGSFELTSKPILKSLSIGKKKKSLTATAKRLGGERQWRTSMGKGLTERQCGAVKGSASYDIVIAPRSNGSTRCIQSSSVIRDLRVTDSDRAASSRLNTLNIIR